MNLVQNNLNLVKAKSLALVLAAVVSFSTLAQAQEIDQFSSSDLPTESVMPLVDYPEMVLNKNVTFTNKWAMAGMYSRGTDEMFFDNNLMGFRLGYFWDEFSAAGFSYQIWNSGLSDYSKVFAQNSAELQVQLAPTPQNQFFLYFEQQYFYGKISVARDVVAPFLFLGRYSLGMTKYDTQSLPHFNYSLGYQSFFGKNFFIEMTLGLSLHQAYNPVGLNIRNSVPVLATPPSKTDFPKKIQFSQSLNLSAGLLF